MKTIHIENHCPTVTDFDALIRVGIAMEMIKDQGLEGNGSGGFSYGGVYMYFSKQDGLNTFTLNNALPADTGAQ